MSQNTITIDVEPNWGNLLDYIEHMREEARTRCDEEQERHYARLERKIRRGTATKKEIYEGL